MREGNMRAIVKKVFSRLAIVLAFSFLIVSMAAGEPKQLSKSLYRLDDTCNVYVVKSGDKALCVDFGSGDVMGELKAMNVKDVEWILHTHVHRDQCQGDEKVGGKVKIAIPAKEEQFFAKADEFWRDVKIYDNYTFKPDFFTPRSNLPVDKTLGDGEVFSWRGTDFEAVETPGHTEGSVSYVATIDGQRVAFTGDLIHSPGKVWNIYSLSYRYNDMCRKGAENTISSLRMLLDKNVAVFYPSHGEPIDARKEAIDELESNLTKVVQQCALPPLPPGGIPKAELKQYLPHVYHKHTSFFIVADSGNVFVYDYGGDDERGAQGGDTIAELFQKSNAKRVDLVLHSHYHDDHVAGTHYLVEKYGAKVWALDKMLDVLENPSRYNIPCLVETPIKVDRVLHDWETFRWQDYTFTAFHFPGQTEWHMGLLAEIDGHRILFSGDTWADVPGGQRPTTADINWRNYCRLEDDYGLMLCAKITQQLNPDMMAVAHEGIYKVNEGDLQDLYNWAAKLRPLVSKVVAQPDPNFGTDQNWVSLYPYRVEMRPGERLLVEVRVRNHGAKAAPVSAELHGPVGWTFAPVCSSIVAPAKETVSLVFAVNVPQNADPQGRTVLTADTTFDGVHKGELAEMLVDHGFKMKPVL